MELQVPVCAGKQDLLPRQCQVMEPGAAQQLQLGIGSVELQVVLPILPTVSYFSICRFREGFVSH
jgi:hypothetical protein